jgi:hypothetical protein
MSSKFFATNQSSSIRSDAEFLQQQQSILLSTTGSTTNTTTTSSSASIATLQVNNRFNLQVQDLLLNSSSLYPWRKSKKRNKDGMERHATSSSTSAYNDPTDEMAMKIWWKDVQEYIQHNITDKLLEIPLSRLLTDNDIQQKNMTKALQVVPFESKEYPPLGIFTYPYTMMIPTINITVLLPISSLSLSKNDYKNEIYFKVLYEY